MRRSFLFATCFLMGFAILGLELLGFRIYGPQYGYSSYVAGTLIGVILAALSFGYYIGGALADRYPRPGVLFRLLTIAGLLLVGFCFVYKPVLEWFMASAGFIPGLVVVTVLLYGPIMVLLSVTSPFIIRLVVEEDRVGTAAGSIYALSTIGSILGSFLTPFVLVPGIGSHMTLVVMTAIVLAVGVAGLVGLRPVWGLALLALGLTPLSFPKAEQGVLLRVESPYSDLQVRKLDPGGYVLAVNRWAYYSRDVTGAQGMRTYSYYDYFLLGPVLVPRVEEMAVLGMAAGTSIKQIQAYYPWIHIDAVEIDPWVVRLAKTKYFGLEESETLAIHTQDARPFMRAAEKQYDFVEIDMYQGGPFIPFYVTTVEFFRLVGERMSDDGLAMANVLALSHDRDRPTTEGQLLVWCVVKSFQETGQFPSVYVLAHHSNFLIFAFKKETPIGEVRRRLAAVATNEALRERLGAEKVGTLTSVAGLAGAITVPERFPGAHAFYDDNADVERITFDMVRRYTEQKRLEGRK
ncbi:MAG: fused MFS/spermidine synthase [Verrucomicrobia bacterium]|nr:fused MFS/spermidine synthase [Verrucomicrobiota bacterium]